MKSLGYVLSTMEFYTLNKIARNTKCDNWLLIKQNFFRGDYIYDLEEHKKLSLKSGILMLFEAIDEQSLIDSCELTKEEIEVVKGLVKHFDLKVFENIKFYY